MIDDAQLLRMNRTQLNDLFRGGTSGPLPDGVTDGTALLAPGTEWNASIARITGAFVWKGKRFDARRGIAINRISPFDLGDVVALVYEEPSWFDGKPCIVLDYSKTSMGACFIRDEIRVMAPGLYLGKAYVGRVPLFWFSLRAQGAQGLAEV